MESKQLIQFKKVVLSPYIGLIHQMLQETQGTQNEELFKIMLESVTNDRKILTEKQIDDLLKHLMNLEKKKAYEKNISGRPYNSAQSSGPGFFNNDAQFQGRPRFCENAVRPNFSNARPPFAPRSAPGTQTAHQRFNRDPRKQREPGGLNPWAPWSYDPPINREQNSFPNPPTVETSHHPSAVFEENLRPRSSDGHRTEVSSRLPSNGSRTPSRNGDRQASRSSERSGREHHNSPPRSHYQAKRSRTPFRRDDRSKSPERSRREPDQRSRSNYQAKRLRTTFKRDDRFESPSFKRSRSKSNDYRRSVSRSIRFSKSKYLKPGFTKKPFQGQTRPLVSMHRARNPCDDDENPEDLRHVLQLKENAQQTQTVNRNSFIELKLSDQLHNKLGEEPQANIALPPAIVETETPQDLEIGARLKSIYEVIKTTNTWELKDKLSAAKSIDVCPKMQERRKSVSQIAEKPEIQERRKSVYHIAEEQERRKSVYQIAEKPDETKTWENKIQLLQKANTNEEIKTPQVGGIINRRMSCYRIPKVSDAQKPNTNENASEPRKIGDASKFPLNDEKINRVVPNRRKSCYRMEENSTTKEIEKVSSSKSSLLSSYDPREEAVVPKTVYGFLGKKRESCDFPGAAKQRKLSRSFENLSSTDIAIDQNDASQHPKFSQISQSEKPAKDKAMPKENPSSTEEKSSETESKVVSNKIVSKVGLSSTAQRNQDSSVGGEKLIVAKLKEIVDTHQQKSKEEVAGKMKTVLGQENYEKMKSVFTEVPNEVAETSKIKKIPVDKPGSSKPPNKATLITVASAEVVEKSEMKIPVSKPAKFLKAGRKYASKSTKQSIKVYPRSSTKKDSSEKSPEQTKQNVPRKEQAILKLTKDSAEEKIKSKASKPTNIPAEEPPVLNVSKEPEESSLPAKEPKTRKKCNELDKLHRDIASSFDCDGIVAASGTRSCTKIRNKSEELQEKLFKQYHLKKCKIVLKRLNLEGLKLPINTNQEFVIQRPELEKPKASPEVKGKATKKDLHETEIIKKTGKETKKDLRATEITKKPEEETKDRLTEIIKKPETTVATAEEKETEKDLPLAVDILPEVNVETTQSEMKNSPVITKPKAVTPHKKFKWSRGIIKKPKRKFKKIQVEEEEEWESAEETLNEVERVSLPDEKKMSLKTCVAFMDNCCNISEMKKVKNLDRKIDALMTDLNSDSLSLSPKTSLPKVLSVEKIVPKVLSAKMNNSETFSPIPVIESVVVNTTCSPKSESVVVNTTSSPKSESVVKRTSIPKLSPLRATGTPSNSLAITKFGFLTAENFSVKKCKDATMFSCKICNLLSVDLSSFRNHIEKAHAHKQWSKFCLECKANLFYLDGSLLTEFRHLLSHNEEKPEQEDKPSHKTFEIVLAPQVLPDETSKAILKQLQNVSNSKPKLNQVLPGYVLKKPSNDAPTNYKIIEKPASLPKTASNPEREAQVSTTPASSNQESQVKDSDRTQLSLKEHLLSTAVQGKSKTPSENPATTFTVTTIERIYGTPSASTSTCPKSRQLPSDNTPISKIQPWLIGVKSAIKCEKASTEMLKNVTCLALLYKCMGSKCKFFTSDSLYFKRHLAHHVNLQIEDQANFLSCAYCSFSAEESSKLCQHIAKNHSNDRYQCKYCFYRAASDFHVFYHHQKRFHLKLPKAVIECPQLQERNESAQELKNQYIKKNVKSLKCCFCPSESPKEFYIIEAFEEHINTHPQKPIICDKCKSKVEQDSLVSHLMECDEAFGIYQCIYCAFGCTDFKILDNHVAEFHSSQSPFICKRIISNVHEMVDPSSLDSLTLIRIKKTLQSVSRINVTPDQVDFANGGNITNIDINHETEVPSKNAAESDAPMDFQIANVVSLSNSNIVW